jgi:hypothetical protein
LIAVSSNLRRITIFAHGYTTSPKQEVEDEDKIREIETLASKQKFTDFLGDDIARERHLNYVSHFFQHCFNIQFLLVQSLLNASISPRRPEQLLTILENGITTWGARS